MLKERTALKKIFYTFIDVLFPNICYNCENKIHHSKFVICSNCVENLKQTNFDLIKSTYDAHFYSDRVINNFYSKYIFEKDSSIQNILHHLKYRKVSKIGIQLGIELGKDLTSFNWFSSIDILIPIPLFKMKEIERGYNQSLMICKGIREVTDKPIDTNSIKRIRNTKSQTQLNLLERQENIMRAFRVKNNSDIIGKSILIVDDVTTTGATSNEGARTLLESGAKEVSLATLAIASPD
ncbi:MAG: phosphoribosyltransferase family protein [Ignavibacteria bacterium]|nr:phosphoribosyltransferase family protein [Ignavibacteria bacterium]